MAITVVSTVVMNSWVLFCKKNHVLSFKMVNKSTPQNPPSFQGYDIYISIELLRDRFKFAIETILHSVHVIFQRGHNCTTCSMDDICSFSSLFFFSFNFFTCSWKKHLDKAQDWLKEGNSIELRKGKPHRVSLLGSFRCTSSAKYYMDVDQYILRILKDFCLVLTKCREIS